MRVLHVLDHSLPVQSGYSFRSQALLLEQRRLGWQTVQLTSSKQGSDAEAAECASGLEFERTAAATGILGRHPVLSQYDTVRRLRRRIRSLIPATRPDLIHAHSPCLTALAAFGLGLPVVYEMRSSWEDAAVSSGVTHEGSARYRVSRALETWVLRRAAAVTTICDGLRREILGRGLSPDKVSVIPNAVDEEFLHRDVRPDDTFRAQLGLAGNWVLGFIGSLFAWEGLDLLIQALPQILAVRPDVRVLLVGRGPHESALRRAVAEKGLDGMVIFAGRMAHDEVFRAYGAVDTLVYPRAPIRLTDMVTPLKPLEAMALGRVFVASDVGGHRELVKNEVTGMLFKAGDSASLARTVLRVISDEQLRASLRDAGRRFVRAERTWARVVRGYEPVYSRLAGPQRTAPSSCS